MDVNLDATSGGMVEIGSLPRSLSGIDGGG